MLQEYPTTIEDQERLEKVEKERNRRREEREKEEKEKGKEEEKEKEREREKEDQSLFREMCALHLIIGEKEILTKAIRFLREDFFLLQVQNLSSSVDFRTITLKILLSLGRGKEKREKRDSFENEKN